MRTLRKTVRLLLIVLLVIIGFYVAYQVYVGLYPPYTTDTASEYTVTDSIECDGIAIRNESVISDTSSGVRDYLVEDGDKIAKNAVVARVFSSVEAAADNLVLSLLEDKLAEARSAEASSTGTLNMEVITSSLYSEIMRTSAAAASDSIDYDELTKGVTDISRLLNSFVAASGGEIDYSIEIARLESDAEKYMQNAQSPTGYVYSDSDGYFVSSVDGLEGTVDMESLLEMTADEIAALLQLTGTRTDASCKTVDGYVWYFAAVTDSKYSERFTVGSSVRLSFNYALVEDVPALVTDIKLTSDGKKAVIIFECDYFNAQLASIRRENASVSFSDYSGIRIDRDWLRTENGEIGVYVKYGSEVQFKPVPYSSMIYKSDDYVIIPSSEGGEGAVALYDEIITSGKDLYAGKQLK